MGFFDVLMGGGMPDEKIQQMLNDGAVIIDVRSPGEFSGGHVAGSQNVPLQEVAARLEVFREIGKPIVLCCATGNRSGQAANFLKAQGIDCENGGGWMQVNGMIC